MRRFLALLGVLLIAACDAPQLTGIADGVELLPSLQAPERPPVHPDEASFRFEPFEGVPGNTGDILLRQLWTRSERAGLTVVKRPTGSALFTVEGTLTAVSDDNSSLVFFAFDVKDVSGKRLYRISGQQRSSEGDGDPWAEISPDDSEVIARRVVMLLRAWLYSDE